ncbi:MAG: hypothetical protein KAS72_05465 [Phycisphaerales bacterium]|nr:hypothetical protein [Phycisphaerales bacterium]
MKRASTGSNPGRLFAHFEIGGSGQLDDPLEWKLINKKILDRGFRWFFDGIIDPPKSAAEKAGMGNRSGKTPDEPDEFDWVYAGVVKATLDWMGDHAALHLHNPGGINRTYGRNIAAQNDPPGRKTKSTPDTPVGRLGLPWMQWDQVEHTKERKRDHGEFQNLDYDWLRDKLATLSSELGSERVHIYLGALHCSIPGIVRMDNTAYADRWEERALASVQDFLDAQCSIIVDAAAVHIPELSHHTTKARQFLDDLKGRVTTQQGGRGYGGQMLLEPRPHVRFMYPRGSTNWADGTFWADDPDFGMYCVLSEWADRGDGSYPDPPEEPVVGPYVAKHDLQGPIVIQVTKIPKHLKGCEWDDPKVVKWWLDRTRELIHQGYDVSAPCNMFMNAAKEYTIEDIYGDTWVPAMDETERPSDPDVTDINDSPVT